MMGSIDQFLRFAGKHVVMASLVFASSSAIAQLKPETQLGSRIPVKPNVIEAERAGATTKAFARCIHRRNPARANELIRSGDQSGVKSEKFTGKALRVSMGMEQCLSGQVTQAQLGISLQMSNASLRSMLQEEAYLAAFEYFPRLPEGATEQIVRSFVSEGPELASAKAGGAFADCITFKDGRGADSLLRTMPGSAAEESAARALAPTLGACLTQGQSLKLNARNVRVFVADGMWTRFLGQSAPRP